MNIIYSTTNNFNNTFKNNWYKVSDNFAVISISKNACSTVNIQSWCYQNKLDINDYKQYKYNHLSEVNLAYIFCANKQYLLRKKPEGIKYVCIIRDPLKRLISAYKTKAFIKSNKLSFNQFLLNVNNTFNGSKISINQHIQTQSEHFNFEDVDIFVYAHDYEKFCKENNINFIKVNKNPDEEYQHKIILSDDDYKLVKKIYASDYDMIQKVKQSGKLYGTL
jgi:hypothetical protein